MCSSDLNKMKQLCLALQNFHDSRKVYPAAIDRYSATAATFNTNSTATSPGGFSWIVHILPYMEENNLYNILSSNTNRFARGVVPFGPTVLGAGTGHASQTQLPGLVCPSYSGQGVVQMQTGSNFKSALAGVVPYNQIAITNYKAMTGLLTQSKAGSPTSPLTDNGAMPLRSPKTANFDTDNLPQFGRPIAAMRDGTAKTVIVCESREAGNSAWIDGYQTWVAAVSDDSGALPTLVNGVWVTTGVQSALAYGPTVTAQGRRSAILGSRGTLGDTAWGPSSDHSGGLTMVGYVDGHNSTVTSDIDPGVFFAICTADQGEAASAE